MDSITNIIYHKKIKTVTCYKNHVQEKEIRLPKDLIKRRRLFIEWYLKEHSTISIATNISDLSKYYLYLSERTIENLLFQNASTTKPY